jgi:radical SAM superfamily enzyme YgiQ (UPF0313 family)
VNKKILLIQPRHGIWDGVFIRFPESVLSVAALPHAKGYDVKVLDLRVTKDWENILKDYLKDGKPICVGITALTGPAIRDLLTSVKIIKEFDNSIPIIFGGVHATLLPEQSLAHDGIDVVIKGEGDYTFYEVVKIFEKNNLDEVLGSDVLNGVKGIYYFKRTSNNGVVNKHLESEKVVKEENLTIKNPHVNDNYGNNIVFTGETPLIMDLDTLPDTPYELLDLPKYNAADLGNGISASFQTSRGCPFACKFCGNEVLQQRKMRSISVSKLVAKIKMLQSKYGYNSFLFVDDLTLAGRKQFIEFASALKEIRPKIAWSSTGIRANLISRLNEDDIQLLWDSGCRSLDIGIESGSARMLKHIDKADTKDNMIKANKIISTLPFKTKYTFIVGYPTETDSETNETIEFFLQLQKDNPNIYPMFFIYLPIIGTRLYNEILEAKLFKNPNTLKGWIDIDSTSWFYKRDNWIPNSKRREMSMIMISSLFCSKNAKVRFTTTLGKIAFFLYHPIAKLRFKYKFFKLPAESYTISIIQKLFLNRSLSIIGN